MKKCKFFLSLIAFLLLSSLIVVGAGKKEAPAPEVMEKEAEKVPEVMPVAFEFYHGLGGFLGEVLEGMVDDFNKSQDEVFVKPVFNADYITLAQKLQASIAAKKPPALAQFDDPRLAQFANAGALLPLDDFMARQDFQRIKDDYVAGFIKAATYNDNVYGIPMQRSTPALYYRKDIFEEYGIDPARLETWEGVREVCIELVDKGAVKYGFVPMHYPWFFVSYLRAAGGEWFNEDYSRSTFGSPEGIRMFQFFHNLVHKDKVAYVHFGGSGWQYWYDSEGDMITGIAAMYNGSTGDQGDLAKAAKEQGLDPNIIGLAFMPRFENEKHSVPFGGTSGAILKDVPEEQKEAAWKFLLWFSSPEQTAYWSKTTGYLPTRYSAEKFLDVEKNPNAKTALAQLKYAEPEPMTGVWNEIYKGPLQTLIDNIFIKPGIDVRAVVLDAQKEANMIIKESL